MLIASAKHIIKPMYCIYGSKTGCGVGEPQGRMPRYRFVSVLHHVHIHVNNMTRHKLYRNVSHSVFNTLKTVNAWFQIQATVSFFLMQAVCSLKCVIFA